MIGVREVKTVCPICRCGMGREQRHSMTPVAKRPMFKGWTFIQAVTFPGMEGDAWQNKNTCVISSLEDAELPQSGGKSGPTWHVSVSAFRPNGNVRPTPMQVRDALRAFGMRFAEEDNHHPGRARHFFMPVDPAYRNVCECKTDETQVVEADGYTWSNAKDHCRGCAIAPVTGKPCPVHP